MLVTLLVLLVLVADVYTFHVPRLSFRGMLKKSTLIFPKTPALNSYEPMLDGEAQMIAIYDEMGQDYQARKIAWDAAVAENAKLKKPKVIRPLKPMFDDIREFQKYKKAQEQKKLSKEDKELQKLQKDEEKAKLREEEMKTWDWTDSRNYVFTHDDKTDRYVPSIIEPTWFAAEVFYNKVDHVVAEVQKPPFNDIVTAWYCDPAPMELAFTGRGRNATLAYKEINHRKLKVTTRTLYLKMIMNKDIELQMKTIDGLWYFQRTGDKFLVLPCSPYLQGDLDMKNATAPAEKPVVSEEDQKLRVGDWVEVIVGERVGQRGILEGVLDGKLRVRLQPVEVAVSIDLDHVCRLDETAHKTPKAMSVRQAAEAVLAKNPHSPVLRHMISMGVLNEVLYSDQPYLDEKMSAPPAKKATTRSKKAQMPKKELALEDIDPRIFIARALREEEIKARDAGKELPKKVRMPRMPDIQSFSRSDDYKKALIAYDKEVRAIKDASKAQSDT